MGDNEHVPAVVQASVLAFRGGGSQLSRKGCCMTLFL
jgi:hypothetical protein